MAKFIEHEFGTELSEILLEHFPTQVTKSLKFNIRDSL